MDFEEGEGKKRESDLFFFLFPPTSHSFFFFFPDLPKTMITIC